MSHIKILIICGGRSPEHKISLLSAYNVIAAIDTNRFAVQLVTIDYNGAWHLHTNVEDFIEHNHDIQKITIKYKNDPTTVHNSNNHIIAPLIQTALSTIDVVFPLLHGNYGEDGTIQGLCEIFGVKYIGAKVLSSAICMDKDISKQILHNNNFKITPFITLRNSDNIPNFQHISTQLGPKVFVKPANMGSSIGISKVDSKHQWEEALTTAFKQDYKIIIEKSLVAREIEVAVLGNESPQASCPGEISSHYDFYNYEAKYCDPKGATLTIPSPLTPQQTTIVRELAISAFKTLNCRGLARVDFFLTKDNNFYLNEVNTMPGFTDISMFPSLWQYSGISYKNLISKLIDLALE